jgi:sporulation protein YlmC with PRC-barrel domain
MEEFDMLKTLIVAAVVTGSAVGAYAQTAPPSSSSPGTSPAPAAAERTVSTGDFNVGGDMSAGAIIGAKVRNENKDSIGKVADVYLDKDGTVKTIVISVGGVLGVGGKDVAVKWSDIQFGRDDKSVTLTTALTKDALNAMPDYNKSERRKPEPPETASMPASPAGTRSR